jgi:sialate O-acetylesterase
MKITSISFLTLIVFFVTSFHLDAAIKLPQIIGDHMVLQQKQEVRIWGWADKNEWVTIDFNGQKVKTRADKEGNWSAVLEPMDAGGPYEMTITGENQIKLKDILIGEVWICSGQSNMEWPVSMVNNAKKEIEQADYPKIRIFDVPRNLQLEPVNDIPETDWNSVTPKTVSGFSAVGYFFGRHLHQELGVPIGLVGSNWGGTVVETWTSKSSINTVDFFDDKMQTLEKLDREELEKRMQEKVNEIKKSISYEKDGLQQGYAIWAKLDFDDSQWKTMDLPTLWEEGPLPSLDGIVWFRKSISLSKEQARNASMLHLGKIDDSDMTWVNGTLVGEMENMYDAERNYRVPAEVLKEGDNVITIRVEDTGGGGGIYGNPENMQLTSANYQLPLTGEWKYQVSPKNLSVGSSKLSPNDYPTLLYNGMIHPIEKYTFQGAIWYQGESNASRAYQYRELFPLMINDWRKQFENPDLSFLFVQLANFMQVKDKPQESAWAELREAQTMTLELPKTGMAVTIDIGEADDIHPRNKQDVGYRLALAARHIEYGQNIVYSGPVYSSMQVEGNKVKLTFNHIGSGLVAKNKFGCLMGFQIAAEDKQWHWAKAYIENDKVIVHSENVQKPVAVRYAWADNPEEANLYNVEGLPASPFKTDSWKGITR